MSQADRRAAVQAADENTALRTRLQRYEEEDRAAKTVDYTEPVDASVVDKLRRKNTALRAQNADLERELAELKTINVTELYHEYTRLNTRRAFLNNENSGLQRILANQRGDVRRATRAVNGQQEMRRQTEEQAASQKADIQMFKDRREHLQKETAQLSREEVQLQEELKYLGSHAGASYEDEVKKLQEDNARKDEQIARLEAELGDTSNHGHNSDNGSDTAQDEIATLREDYVRLKEQLKRAKAM